LTVAASATTWMTTWLPVPSRLPAGHSSEPHQHGIAVTRAANADSASARRWALVRGLAGHTVAANSSRRRSKAIASDARTSPQISAIPEYSGDTPIWRPSSRLRATRVAAGSSCWMK
jgi:hypothetical protein